MTAFDIYLRALQKLHEDAGSPSSRDIVRLSGTTLSHSTVNDLLRGRRIGTWRRTTAPVVFVLAERASDASAVDKIHKLWSLVQQKQDQQQKKPTEAELLTRILQELQAQRAMLERLTRVHCPHECPSVISLSPEPADGSYLPSPDRSCTRQS